MRKKSRDNGFILDGNGFNNADAMETGYIKVLIFRYHKVNMKQIFSAEFLM